MNEINRLVKHFGSVAATAGFFPVEPSAVYQWLEKGHIPRERHYELMVRLPELFPARVLPRKSKSTSRK